MSDIVSLDCETHRIGPGAVAPKVVCTSIRKGQLTKLYGNGDEEMEEVIKELLLDRGTILVGHNMKYDMGCLYYSYPGLQPAIWKAYREQRITDTQLRERLLNLSSHGNLDTLLLPDKTSVKLDYSLAGLAHKYLGKDRFAQKEGADTWRLNYGTLDGWKAEAYPEEARDYAMNDAIDTLEVYRAQEERVLSPEGGPCSTKTEFFQAACDFAHYLMTIRGIKTDPKAVAEVEKMVNEELDYKKLNLLLDSGILEPPQPGRPYANKAKNKDGTLKLTKPKKEKVNTKALKQVVEAVCQEEGIKVKVTRTGEIKTDKDVLAVLETKSEILAQYQHRQNLIKLRTTEIPRMSTGTVHPNFKMVVRSGRTSSFAGKKPLYPSINIQNVDKRTRHCYIPREGMVLLAADYSFIELVSLAQRCQDLLGHSVLKDLICEGIDPHAFLGAQLAYNFEERFQRVCNIHGRTPIQRYALFTRFKTSGNEGDRDFFKHYRTFAKPTGLGYPGGLGPKKFVSYARSQFGIVISFEQAKRMREIWHETFPEMADYFGYISGNCVDPKSPDEYCFFSPLGMYRAGATYCAACNGNALQTPTSEGAKGAVFEVVRACYEQSPTGIVLKDCYPLAFVHDEILLEILENDQMHENAMMIQKIMVDAMKKIMPDVPIGVEVSLMRFWSKAAEPVFKDGRLQIWTPNQS